MFSFIRVSQGHVLRWQYDQANKESLEGGLFTDGFFNCLIVVIISKDKSKISLYHADEEKLDIIKKEIEWTGLDAEKVIYYKDQEDAKSDIKYLFKGDPLEKEFNFLRINKMKDTNGKIIIDKRRLPLPGGGMLPEYEADTVFVDNKGHRIGKAHLSSYNIIDRLPEVKKVYSKKQKVSWGTYPQSMVESSKDINLRALLHTVNSLPGGVLNTNFSAVAPKPAKDCYNLAAKIPAGDNSFILALKSLYPNLFFHPVRDEDYKIDVVFQVSDKSRSQIKLLGQQINMGRFMPDEKGKELFVIEGVNLSMQPPLSTRMSFPK